MSMTESLPPAAQDGPPALRAIRLGVRRGLIEVRQVLTTPQDLAGLIIPNLILLTVMILLRGKSIPGSPVSLGATTLPGVMGTGVVFGGMTNLAQNLTVEREDGTLLRAKAIPQGILAYLVGKIVQSSLISLLVLAATLIAGLLLFDGIGAGGPGHWVLLLAVLVAGLVATMPLGAVVGSLFASPRAVGLVTLPIMGLVGISGVFYPVTGLPHWLQWVAQCFPIYWMGLGTRSALLPDAAAAVEIGGSWRHVETFLVLGLWAVVAMVVAPVVLRRMAQRESGSSVSARRDRALQRVG
jgi:ABC-2 type transport system permease protein